MRRISRTSRFCRTRIRMQPAKKSLGTKSVPRKRALNRLATWVNASFPYSSFRRQQKIHRKRRNQTFESLRCNADSVGPFPLSLLSLVLRYFAEPNGSNTIARPKIINENRNQLKMTIAVNHKTLVKKYLRKIIF